MEQRFTRTGGQSADGAGDDTAYGVALTLVAGYRLCKTVRVGLCAHLHQFRPYRDTLRGQRLAGQTTGYDPRRRLTRRSTSAATPISYTVFLLIGAVGVPHAERTAQRLVVFRPCIAVANQKSNRRTQGNKVCTLYSVSAAVCILYNPAEPLHLVGLILGANRYTCNLSPITCNLLYPVTCNLSPRASI